MAESKVKIVLLFALTGVLCTGCASSHREATSFLGSQVRDYRRDEGVLVSSSQFSYGVAEVLLRGVHYTLGVDRDQTVMYVSTEDQDFVSPEGVRIGQRYEDVRQVAASDLIRERGWAFYMALPSGWNAAFVQGNTMTEGELSDDTPVCFLFVRRK